MLEAALLLLFPIIKVYIYIMLRLWYHGISSFLSWYIPAGFTWYFVECFLLTQTRYGQLRVCVSIEMIVLIYDATSILISSGKLEGLPVSWRIATLLLSAWHLGNVMCSKLWAKTPLLSFLLGLWCMCYHYCSIVSQFWCSFITFPLYVIITQVCL